MDTASHDFLKGMDHILVVVMESLRFHWSKVVPLAVLEGLEAEVAVVSPEETPGTGDALPSIRHGTEQYSYGRCALSGYP